MLMDCSGGHLVSSLCLLFIAYALTPAQMYHFSEMVRKACLLGHDRYLIVVFGNHFVQSVVPYIPRSIFLRWRGVYHMPFFSIAATVFKTGDQTFSKALDQSSVWRVLLRIAVAGLSDD